MLVLVVVGGTRLKKSGLYLYAKKLGASVLLQFWRPRRCFYNFGAEGAFFLVNFWRLSALFIVNVGAEGAVYYHFWRRRRFLLSKALCKDALYCNVDCVCIMYSTSKLVLS